MAVVGLFSDSRTLWMCACMSAQSPQSCPTLCDPMDYSPPGSSVHGILQVRILEWVDIPSSRGSSQLRNQTHVTSCLLHGQAALPLAPMGSPYGCVTLANSLIKLISLIYKTGLIKPLISWEYHYSCPNLSIPMEYGTLDFPVLHRHAELVQTHVH